MHYFGRAWGEADIEPDFMSTRPNYLARPGRLSNAGYRNLVSCDVGSWHLADITIALGEYPVLGKIDITKAETTAQFVSTGPNKDTVRPTLFPSP
jgi:hypothetical protein